MTSNSKGGWIARIKSKLHFDAFPPATRRIVVGVVGGTILLIGVALIVLPGPAFIVIPVGLAILATEFVWAQRWLHKAKRLLPKKKKKTDGAP
jgi:tellurite resistance protein TerC